MLNIIHEFASNIEKKWKDADNSVYHFSDISLQEIKKYDLASEFDFNAMNTLLDNNHVRNVQIASEFSELHFKLFDNGRFYVEILNWWDKDTSIHDHGFSGVLVQLRGAALNALYSFENEDISTSQTLRYGNVKLVGAEISQEGDIRVIPWGRTERHAVFHIAQPTISLIVRTHPVDDISPQLNYFAPYLMSNYSASGIAFSKRVKYFKLLERMNKSDFRGQLFTTLSNSSHTDCFWLFMKLGGLLFNSGNIELLQEWINVSSDAKERQKREKIVASVACRRASQFIVDHVKPYFADYETRLFLAAIAASYSENERNFMFEKLDIKFDDTRIAEVKSKLSPKQATEFSSAAKILNGSWSATPKSS